MKSINVYILRAAASALIAAALLVILVGEYRRDIPALSENPIMSLSATPPAKTGADFILQEKPRILAKFQFHDDTGRVLTIADFQGQMVLLNIWATWCAPCLREMPALDRLQVKLGQKTLVVVALSIDQSGLAKVEKFYKNQDLTALPIYVSASPNVTDDLGVIGVPTTLLLDRRGREVARLVGPAEWDSPEMIAFLRNRIAQENKLPVLEKD